MDKIDLSSLWFIYSMNMFPEDTALRDRLYIIELEGYTIDEKVSILINFVSLYKPSPDYLV